MHGCERLGDKIRERVAQASIQASLDSNLQQRPRFGHADGGAAIFAGGHSRQRHQMAPAERRSGPGEFLRHSAIEFFRVQRPVFADRVA